MKTKNSVSLALLGGDQRQIFAAKRLATRGFSVYLWGCGTTASSIPLVRTCTDWKDAIAHVPYLVLPLPTTNDGVHLHTPLSGGTELRLDVLLDAIEGKTLLGGRLNEVFVRRAEESHVRCIDYFTSEILQRKNALPTVEGAIEIAMQRLPVTLADSEFAVIGYGRIGELLAYKLTLLGARVTVYARREEALCRARLFGCKTERLAESGEEMKNFKLHPATRAIFHTVPVCLFTRDVLKDLPHETLHVDLSSAPGGLDHASAKALGISTVWATSLPGKYAPETAGEIIADTIEMILEDHSRDLGEHREDTR